MKEKIFDKFNLFYILAVFLVVVCAFVGCSSIVNAEEIEEEKSYYDYEYCYTCTSEYSVAGNYFDYTRIFYDDKPFCFSLNGGSNLNLVTLDGRKIHLYTLSVVNSSGEITTIESDEMVSTSRSGQYFYPYDTDKFTSIGVPLFNTIDEALAFLNYGDDSGQLNKPEEFCPVWDDAKKSNTVGLNAFNAIYKDCVVITTWNGVSSRVVDLSSYKNTYVKAIAGFCDKETGVISDVEIGIFSFDDNGFTYEVPQEFLEYTYLRYVKCTPFYYESDDISKTLYKGIDSFYYWDSNGNISSSDMSSSNIDGLYDSEIGYLKLSINGLSGSECHGGNISWTNCFSLSWDVPTYNRNKYEEFCEFKFDFRYSYTTNWSTSLKYGTAFIDYSENGEKLCVNVKNGAYNFCAKTFSEILDIQNSFENYSETLSSFNINPLNKVYVRIIRKDIVTGDFSYGDWAVYNIDKSTGILTLNKELTGDMNIYEGDTKIDADGEIYDKPIYSVSGNNDNDSEGSFFSGIDLSDVANIGKYFITLIDSLMNFLGDFPALFSRIFSFLPAELLAMIYMSIVIVVVIGLFKIFL